MSSLEKELQDLRDKNNELVKKVQYWKMTAAQRENEKLELIKETNELRLKLGRLRSGGAAQARKLDGAIQSSSKQALSHLVQASSAVARTMQLVKNYMNERQELEAALPRWSSVSNTPNSDRVHRVPPMMIGGQSIQPVVSLSRTMIDLNNRRTSGSPNNTQNNNFQRRALPMHDLQDLYIPLTRIDYPLNNMDADDEEENNNAEDGLDDSTGQELQESQNVSDNDDFDESERLGVVTEDIEPEDEEHQTPRPRSENPLEGPSWMLDGQNKSRRTKSKANLEPDSTTECDNTEQSPLAGPSRSNLDRNLECVRATAACEFTPTVRRRKRGSPPAAAAASPPPSPSPRPFSPRPLARRNSNNGRILKVLVSKLRLDDDDDDATPPKRPSLDKSPRAPEASPILAMTKNSPLRKPRDFLRDTSLSDDSGSGRPLQVGRDARLSSFDAPSPNGATTSHVIVSDSTAPLDAGASGEPMVVARKISKRDNRASRDNSHDNRSSRDNTHNNRSSRDISHDDQTSRDNGHDNRSSRDNTHDNRSSRDNTHNNRSSRDISHDDQSSRDNGHDNRSSRDNNPDNRSSRDNSHENRSSRDNGHDNRSSRENRHENRTKRNKSHEVKYEARREGTSGPDSDSGSGGELATEGRTRRPRKEVTYKEKPLNRKMRR